MIDECLTEGFFGFEDDQGVKEDKIVVDDWTQARVSVMGRLLMGHARPPIPPDSRRRRAWGAEGRYDHTFRRRLNLVGLNDPVTSPQHSGSVV